MTTQTATSTPAATEPPQLGEAHLAFLFEHVLGHHERGEIGLRLQDELVDLVDLTLIGKQLHWNVVGPHFRTLHLYLDELVDEWRLLADAVAERGRERMERLGEIDSASDDVMIDVVRKLEEQLWMIRAQFEAG